MCVSVSAAATSCWVLPAGLRYVTFYLDNQVSNPSRLWQDMGRPDFPSVDQFRLLRSQQVTGHAP